MMRLQKANPQVANQIQEMINSKGNPMSMYQQIIKDKTPEQMEQFYAFARQCGIPNDVINQVQNGNNTN